MPKPKAKKDYITANLPREWKPFLDEALDQPEIRKKIEIGNFTKTHSGLINYITYEFLVNNTSFRFQHFNTYKNHITIVDNKIRRMVDIYPKNSGELWCEHCDSTKCEHVNFVFSQNDIIKDLEKKGWKQREG